MAAVQSPGNETDEGGAGSPGRAALLLELCEGDREFAEALVETFADDARPRCDLLATAVLAGDLEVVGKEAHALKGGASHFGPSPAIDALLALEARLGGGDAEAVAAAASLAVRAVRELIQELAQITAHW